MRVPLPGDNALGIILPDQLCRIIDPWRKEYDPFYEIFPPHITLIYPPFITPREWEKLKPELQKLLQHFFQFDICLNELGNFNSEQNWVLWIKPEDNGCLHLLRKLIVNRFWEYISIMPFDYIPHVTVGRFDSYQDYLLAEKRVKNELVPMKFKLKTIHYLIFDDKWTFNIEDKVNIGE